MSKKTTVLLDAIRLHNGLDTTVSNRRNKPCFAFSWTSRGSQSLVRLSAASRSCWGRFSPAMACWSTNCRCSAAQRGPGECPSSTAKGWREGSPRAYVVFSHQSGRYPVKAARHAAPTTSPTSPTATMGTLSTLIKSDSDIASRQIATSRHLSLSLKKPPREQPYKRRSFASATSSTPSN